MWIAGGLVLQGAGLFIVDPPNKMPPSPPGKPPRDLILPPWRPPPWRPIWAPLEVSSVKVKTAIKDQIAQTSVEQEFHNPNPMPLEGTFLFPVPRGAHLDRFTMEINGQPAEAELLAADKARKIYENIVRTLKDPGLLEYSDRDVFRVRVFPIEAHARKRITLSYTEILRNEGGLVRFQCPLSPARFSAAPPKQVAIEATIETSRPLKTIYSPSHKIEIRRHDTHRADVHHEVSKSSTHRDFQLYYTADPREIDVRLLTHAKPGEQGFFLLLATPGQSQASPPAPKDVVFVLDTSGSMAGAKIAQARKALSYCVENLNTTDRFEILRFSTEVEALFTRLVDATATNRARALEFINRLKAVGGTAIHDALRGALAATSRPGLGDRPCLVLFLTDGRPTVGETDENLIVRAAIKHAGKDTRVFCFGIGSDVNTHLLDKITEGTRAASQYVLEEEDLELKVTSLFAKMHEPALTRPELRFPDGIRVFQMHPEPVPDLFMGDQIIVAGRYTGKGRGSIVLKGNIRGQPQTFEFPVEFGAESVGNDFIPPLWATRRVGWLLDQIRLRGESRETREEVIRLAKAYGVITPYTAWLIQEDERLRDLPAERRTWSRSRRDDPMFLESGQLYQSTLRERSGNRAVLGARSHQYLKAAEAPQDALMMSAAEAFRAAPPAAPDQGHGWPGQSTSTPSHEAHVLGQQTAAAMAAECCHIGGKTFYFLEGIWVDVEAQSKANLETRRVVLGSDSYFALMQEAPETRTWLSLGPRVRFVLGQRIVEVVEAEGQNP